MSRPSILKRAAFGTVAGALIGATATLIVGAERATVETDFDRASPSYLSGFYPSEQAGALTFAWTAPRALIRLPGLDRSVEWRCTIRLRGQRSQAEGMPTVSAVVDGVNAVTVSTSNDFADMVIPLPLRRDRSGAVVSLTSAPTFTPGGGDPRELGVQVDRLACAPARGWAWPPSQALSSVVASSAVFGVSVALAGASIPVILAATLIVDVGLALLVTSLGAAFGPFPHALAWVVMTTSGLLVLAGRAAARIGQGEVGRASVLALSVAAASFMLRTLALLHPGKALVDALFQAHRLEWVMGGRYFFTQAMPDGVAFPYAIGLYVFAAPWAALVRDHVALLRGVVIAVDVLAMGLVCVALARMWRDRASGVVTLVFAALAPLPYLVIGNGNLTNAFGQSIALVSLALLATGFLNRTTAWRMAAFALIVALGLVSHVSTFALLLAALGLTAVGLVTLGRGQWTREAVVILVLTAVAVVLAFGLYYRHFMDVYREAVSRVLSPSSAIVTSAPASAAAGSDLAMLTRPLSWGERVGDALEQTRDAVGWPMLALALLGMWRAWARGLRDRLSIVVLAWIAVWVIFVGGGTLARVDIQYQRYASEFVGRVNLATYPAVLVLAATGVTWPWTDDGPRAWWLRVATLAVGAAAVLVGLRAWMGWFT